MPKGTVRTGVLLVGHGTRSDTGRKQCQALAKEIVAGLDARVCATELAFLELAEPTIDEGVACLLEKEIERLVVVPLLLFAAGHAKEDIPAAVRLALASAGQADLPMVQTEPLGLQDAMLKLAAGRFREATDPNIQAEDSCLLFVGRGSRDEEATADMLKLGDLLHERVGVGQTQVGFLAMAEPNAQVLIHKATSNSFRQIVVQPHLFFHGELLDRLEVCVKAAAASSPGKTWRISWVLGAETGPLAQILLQGIRLTGNIQ